jgi:cytochrome c-type biogenesis protein CcmE
VKKQRKFAAAAVALVGVVGYLMVTGMKDAATYYYTPSELVSAVGRDASLHELGYKVGGRVLPGSVRYDQRTLDLQFRVVDIANGSTHFPVTYNGPLPDTFQEGRDVVIEGKFTRAGTFEASTVLTKCGSRYEAAESELKKL